MKAAELIKRVTIGGYVKADTVGNGSWEIGRITKFDNTHVWFVSALDGVEIQIRRDQAYKATADEHQLEVDRFNHKALIAAVASAQEEEFENEMQYVEEPEATPVFEEVEVTTRSKSIVPEDYRRKYVRTTSASGTKSLNNGDRVAQMLAGKDLEECYDVLGTMIDDVSLDTKMAKWSHLNKGQQRMAIGNTIRRILANKA